MLVCCILPLMTLGERNVCKEIATFRSKRLKFIQLYSSNQYKVVSKNKRSYNRHRGVIKLH